MAYEKKIATLTVLLAVVLALCAYLFAGQQLNTPETLTLNKLKELEETSMKANVEYVEVTKEVSKKDTRKVVSDKFSQKIETDGQLIVVGKDGSIRSVTSGIILINDNIVSVNQEDSSIIALEKRD